MANATITVLEADGTTQTDVVVLDVGRQAAAASKSIALSTEDKAVLDTLATATVVGGVTETAPASDTASSGLNGRLQRIAQRITTLIGSTLAIGNVATIASVAPAFGDGAKGATVLRTTLATDSAGIITVGTAGTASSQVLSVQGIASMTPLLATLQAGTAAFGKLSANSGVDIGDVDVTSLPALAAGTNNIGHVGGVEYELVAASSSTQTLGATGGTGDYLSHVLIIPETTGAGTVAIKDGSDTAINIFVTGTLSNLVPFVVPIGAKSTSGAWQITTGANVHAIGFGDFT